MKKIIRKLAALKLVWIALCATLFSFSTMPGGDSYEIYLGSKLVLEQRVYLQKEVPTLTLNPSPDQDQLSVHYSHCGQIGTARKITIKDSRNMILKEWHYADAGHGTKTPMAIKVKDLAGINRSGSNALNLFYSSKELPEGRLLASIQLAKDKKIARNQ